ncbi:hypothetical protein [Simplicispira psychrophila]|uniref:hypothetical protein n=1 Tax=Simplicispira psychrophila TaxID=80882 RepID=UPI000482AEBB|nr:hypothetical protein [Simplicispira psychrophila]
MPFPFLIGGLVAAAAAAVAYAISDDDKNDNDNDSDEAERRLKEAAERERKKRDRAQKQEAAYEDFCKQGRAFGKGLAQALPSDLVEAISRNAFKLDFDLKKGAKPIDMEEASRRDSYLFATIDSLEKILTKRASRQKIIENLAIFSELYKPEFQCGAALQEKEARVARINDDIDTLKKIKAQLMKLEKETASAQA